MKSGSAFVSVQQTSFLAPGESANFFSRPSLPRQHLPNAHSPRNANVCGSRDRAGKGRGFCRTFIFWHGYPYPRFICSFACLQQQQQQSLVYLLVFHLDPPSLSKPTQSRNPAAMLNTCMYIITRARPPVQPAAGRQQAACQAAGWGCRLHVARTENFSILCAAVNVKAWYAPLSASLSLPLSLRFHLPRHSACPRPVGHEWKAA